MIVSKQTIAIVFAVALAGMLAGIFIPGLFEGPVPVGQATAKPDGPGWTDLLDQAHQAGWKNTSGKKDIFEIKDGMLHIFGRTIYPLRYVGYTAETLGNVDLHLEFKLSRHTNSGVFLRAQPNDPVARGFEVQVLEDYGKAPNKNSCGSIYDVVTPMFNMSRPRGEWNSYDISLTGSEVTVVMNGWMVVHTDFSKMKTPMGKFKAAYADLPAEGNLLLQDHGGEVWYRNIVIRKR
jgi:hypothetical protein